MCGMALPVKAPAVFSDEPRPSHGHSTDKGRMVAGGLNFACLIGRKAWPAGFVNSALARPRCLSFAAVRPRLMM
eukprot:scaffold659522_cov45-Prasinocladus_malaysianus.AAC.1